ncbi:MAG: hypothetical protein KU37_04195 [Sulfuricurvum sp. PC08-66]|nr:MAG: hypothetical protein KU37_04195 [Sulfuricurvum sp. PC08-66]
MTFTYEPSAGVESVDVCGAWNEWVPEAMKPKKSGEFSITKILKAGENYEFGYKINNTLWATDESCSLVPSPFLSHNSLLAL